MAPSKPNISIQSERRILFCGWLHDKAETCCGAGGNTPAVSTMMENDSQDGGAIHLNTGMRLGFNQTACHGSRLVW